MAEGKLKKTPNEMLVNLVHCNNYRCKYWNKGLCRKDFSWHIYCCPNYEPEGEAE